MAMAALVMATPPRPEEVSVVNMADGLVGVCAKVRSGKAAAAAAVLEMKWRRFIRERGARGRRVKRVWGYGHALREFVPSF